MFNPFEKFTSKYIEAFRKQGKSYLVSQTFERGLDPFNDKGKISLLFSKYDSLSHANIHFSAVKTDKYAALIDLEKEFHRATLIKMMSLDSNYILFVNVIKSIAEAEKRCNAKYTNNIRRFVGKQTNWRVPASEILQPNLDIAFGELFMIIKFRNQQIRPTLEDIEKS